MLGRYLNLDDDILIEIDTANYFQVEKCLKMLITWKDTSKQTATFARLAQGLKDVMREDLISDIGQFIPKPASNTGDFNIEETEVFRLTADENGDIDQLCKVENRFMAQKTKKKQTAAHVTLQFVDICRDAFVFVLPSLDDIRVLKELCVVTNIRTGARKFLVTVKFV